MDLHIYLHLEQTGHAVLDRVLREFDNIKHSLSTIHTQGVQLMSAISDFSARQTTYNDAIDAAVTGLTADVADLKAQIEALQNSPGVITPEDQALLDAIDARSQGISAKLTALDAQTNQAPVPPAG